MSSTKNVLETFRDVVQDLLVPELKAVKVSVDSLRVEMKMSNDAMRAEMRLTTEAIREEMKLRTDSLEKLILLGNEANRQLVHGLSDKFEVAVEVRERLANLEARLPRQ
jgi:hypothetical protein